MATTNVSRVGRYDCTRSSAASVYASPPTAANYAVSTSRWRAHACQLECVWDVGPELPRVGYDHELGQQVHLHTQQRDRRVCMPRPQLTSVAVSAICRLMQLQQACACI